MAPLLQSSLFQQLVHQADAQILLGVWHANVTGFGRVAEDVMAATNRSQFPSVRFELLDDLLAVHSGYCTHHAKMGKSESFDPIKEPTFPLFALEIKTKLRRTCC